MKMISNTSTTSTRGVTLISDFDGGGLIVPARRSWMCRRRLWRLFFGREVRNPRYLRDVDVTTATIASPDGRLNLGAQHNTVIGKTS